MMQGIGDRTAVIRLCSFALFPLGAHALRGLYSTCPLCVCVSLCRSHRANLRTSASRCLTEGTNVLLVKGTSHTEMRETHMKTTMITSANSDVGRWKKIP